MSPFDDDSSPLLVLVNAERQHSLWPARIDIPPGWRSVFSGDRAACMRFVEEHWTDTRPVPH